MYIIKYWLDTNHKHTARDIANANELHKTIQSMFNSQRKDNHVLFTCYSDHNNPCIVILSDKQPQNVPEYLKEVNATQMTTEYKKGDKLGFIITCNPVTRHKRKRKFIKERESRYIWFDRQARNNGFSLDECSEVASGNVHVEKKGMSFEIPTVTYFGKLSVTDEKLFAKAIQNGIGPEKAYGCGLLIPLFR